MCGTLADDIHLDSDGNIRFKDQAAYEHVNKLNKCIQNYVHGVHCLTKEVSFVEDTVQIMADCIADLKEKVLGARVFLRKLETSIDEGGDCDFRVAEMNAKSVLDKQVLSTLEFNDAWATPVYAGKKNSYPFFETN